MERKKSEYVSRVDKIDSVALDKEIIQVLKGQIYNISKYTSGRFVAKWEPELEAFVRFCIWKFSVHQTYSTFGQQLLDIKYKNAQSRNKSLLILLFMVVPKYIKDRASRISHSSGNRTHLDWVLQMINSAQIIILIANLVNMFIFLRNGVYPTLVDRILCLKYVPSAHQGRRLGYNFMLRDLLWHSLIELVGNTLPFINYYAVRRKVVNLFKKNSVHTSEINPLVFTVQSKCSICNETPVLPYHIGCSHVYCYYCIQGNLLADAGFQCPSCGHSSTKTVAYSIPYKNI